MNRAVNTVTRTVTISDLTPAEMASIFATWFDAQQADFFEALWAEGKDWPGGGWDGQFYSLCRKLSKDGQSCVASLTDAYVSSITP